jgi:radical SAM protein with 4Fe4S-binding SPASM domain
MTGVPRIEPAPANRVIAAVACDFERSPIGTRSRLLDLLAGEAVIHRMLQRLIHVEGISAIVVLVPEAQMGRAHELHAEGLQSLGSSAVPIHVRPLTSRPETLDLRVRIARAWDLPAWRGGAGQWTVFDEDYHPAAVAAACQEFAADHMLVVPAHAAFLDAALTSQLVHHHLHKNHEMRLTYTPAAPGLSGLVLQASVVAEMAEKMVLPGQLLAYDPKAPTFDTLIRDACMQVDPALSKIQNRFLVDTDRSWALAERLLTNEPCESLAALALAARDHAQSHLRQGAGFPHPREIEIELTAARLTTPPGTVPAEIRAARGTLDAADWVRWLAAQRFSDDLLITFAGDGDPLLYPALLEVLRAARQANPRSIHLQTDLATDITPLLAAIGENLIDVISINFPGNDAATYAQAAHADLYPAVMANMTKLAEITRTNPRGSGLPLVIPRLLKVRDTIPQLEPFFDTWITNCGWAVIDYPTDRAGSVAFEGVVDMAPPKRRACRRLADRLLIRASGLAVACDQDARDQLRLGSIQTHRLEELWLGESACTLRTQHADGKWDEIDPCKSCREWHRA